MTGTAALGAAVLVFVSAVLPPRSRPLQPPDWSPASPTVNGVFHVHTTRSDGTGSVDQVAAAAARAGLKFVIFTDHGDGTRQPDPPSYRSGVLCLDGVEISTTGGHYAAVGMGQAPFPLGGEPRDVVEDVARLGGVGIVTHPDSAKRALKWDGWDTRFDGLEWLNADSEWRDESRARLAIALITYPFRPTETVASLFERPATLARWDELQRRGRPVLAIAGADAHARVGWKDQGDPYQERTLLAVPSYEATFRAFSIQAVLERAWTSRADEDAETLVRAIRAGHLHTVVDAYASPGAFEFTARTEGAEHVIEGDTTAVVDALVLRARSNAPAGSRLVLFRDGKEVHRVRGSVLAFATNHPGSYRVEAWLPGEAASPMPWIVSNPITAVVSSGDPVRLAQPSPAPTLPVVATIDPATGWSVERDAASAGDASGVTGATRLQYTLSRAERASQFVALAHPIVIPPSAGAVAFTGRASRPMRVSVQVRVPKDRDGQRWQRSIYLDQTAREVVVPFADMRPAGAVSAPTPPLSSVNTLLLVVDRVHAAPGSTGDFAVANVRVLGAGTR